MALERYKNALSPQASAYVEIAQKIAFQGKHLKMSMDAFRINEAQILGYVFRDCMECETMHFWADTMTPLHIVKLLKYQQPDQATLERQATQKLSQCQQENVRIFRQLKVCIPLSNTLQVVHLLCIRIKEEGWDCLGQGIENSKSIKRLTLQNCNLRERNNLQALAKHLERQTTLEYLDLQCNDLNHLKHGLPILTVIKEQYKTRDDLNWKLGLRNQKYYNISTIGLKYINLARNSFDDNFALELARQLETDVYLKCISLKNNKITKTGIQYITDALD